MRKSKAMRVAAAVGLVGFLAILWGLGSLVMAGYYVADKVARFRRSL